MDRLTIQVALHHSQPSSVLVHGEGAFVEVQHQPDGSIFTKTFRSVPFFKMRISPATPYAIPVVKKVGAAIDFTRSPSLRALGKEILADIIT